jgi:hypothetical protein
MNDLPDDHPVFRLLNTVQEAYWGFYPETEYGSHWAHLTMEDYSALAEAFAEFKTAMNSHSASAND